MLIFRFLIFSLILTSTTICSAQYYEFGLGLGASLYYGDLNAPDLSTNLSNSRVAGQVFVRYIPNKNLGFKLNLLAGQLNGDDSKSQEQFQRVRNLSFNSILLEGSFMGEYYLFGYDAREGTQLFSPYATIGIAVSYFNPKTDFMGETYSLQPLGTEGQGLDGNPGKYSRIALSIPFGGGVKFKINDKSNLGVALLARYAFTDYLDDVSTTYPDLNAVANAYGPIAAALSNRQSEALGTEVMNIPGSQRGGEQVNDYYFTIMVNYSINLETIFGLGKSEHTPDCPRF